MKAEEKKKRSILGEWFMYFFGIMMWSVSTEIQKLDAVEKQNKKLIQVPKSLFDKQNSKEISPKHAVDLFVFHLLFHGMQMIPKRDRWDVKGHWNFCARLVHWQAPYTFLSHLFPLLLP